MQYGKLENGSLIYAPGAVTKGNTYYVPYPEEMLIADGYLPVEDTPYPSDGKSYSSSWEEQDSKIVRVWTLIPEPVLTPAQKRERAYIERHIINYNDSMITVDEANKMWYQYAAEGNTDKTEMLTLLISDAKETIRKDYPDASK